MMTQSLPTEKARQPLPTSMFIGWLTRGQRTQAIISAGEGAAAALSILSTEAGRDVHDFDVVKENGDDE